MTVRELLGENFYVGLHSFLRKNYKKPKTCQRCGASAPRLEWANISGIYDRNIENYTALCVRCHRRHDFAGKDGRCINNHELTPENIYSRASGTIECRICRALSRKKYKIRAMGDK